VVFEQSFGLAGIIDYHAQQKGKSNDLKPHLIKRGNSHFSAASFVVIKPSVLSPPVFVGEGNNTIIL